MPGSDIARGDAGSWTVEKGGEAGAGGEKKGEEKKGGEDDWGAGGGGRGGRRLVNYVPTRISTDRTVSTRWFIPETVLGIYDRTRIVIHTAVLRRVYGVPRSGGAR
eukprot:3741152-Rhodomonas_salina.2